MASRPQQPWYYVAGLTTNISSNTTNNFVFSYLRNYWSWSTKGDPVQFPGLGGALEPLGERQYDALTPYNVNTQQTRTRFWDGHDYFFRDDVSTLKENHLFQFGGSYQRNWNYHQRTDNGGGINYYRVYQLGDSVGAGLVDMAAVDAAGDPAFDRQAALAGLAEDGQQDADEDRDDADDDQQFDKSKRRAFALAHYRQLDERESSRALG